jgi:hypothetical protein
MEHGEISVCGWFQTTLSKRGWKGDSGVPDPFLKRTANLGTLFKQQSLL